MFSAVILCVMFFGICRCKLFSVVICGQRVTFVQAKDYSFASSDPADNNRRVWHQGGFSQHIITLVERLYNGAPPASLAAPNRHIIDMGPAYTSSTSMFICSLAYVNNAHDDKTTDFTAHQIMLVRQLHKMEGPEVTLQEIHEIKTNNIDKQWTFESFVTFPGDHVFPIMSGPNGRMIGAVFFRQYLGMGQRNQNAVGCRYNLLHKEVQGLWASSLVTDASAFTGFVFPWIRYHDIVSLPNSSDKEQGRRSPGNRAHTAPP